MKAENNLADTERQIGGRGFTLRRLAGMIMANGKRLGNLGGDRPEYFSAVGVGGTDGFIQPSSGIGRLVSLIRIRDADAD